MYFRSSVRVSLVLDDCTPDVASDNLQLSLPLLPPDSEYRPFRETLDTPLLEQPQRPPTHMGAKGTLRSAFVSIGSTGSQSAVEIHREGLWNSGGGGRKVEGCAGKRVSKKVKKERQLLQEIEMIEMGLINKMGEPENGEIKRSLSEIKLRNEIVRLMSNKFNTKERCLINGS